MALPTLDATFASAADLPRRQMLAKWFVEEMGETQAPSSVLVSGAGDTSVNGLYIYDGTHNGKGKWSLSATKYIQADNLGSGLFWYINNEEIDTYLYVLDSDTEYPWQGTYVTFNGAEPVPTVTEVPYPSPISNYYDLPERYLWAKIAVAAGGPREEAAYISLPKNYAWSDIYNAVAGSSGNHTDWSENVALGHIAAAYRGDTGNPANLATYIDWPWRYKVASIILAL